VVADSAGVALADSNRMDRIVMMRKQSKNSRSAAPAKQSSLEQSSSDKSSKMRMRIEAVIRSIPRGKVSTYGAIAKAARLPGAARQVARVLHRGFGLPWQRVLGAGGEIKLRGDSAIEQRLRLEAEGVRLRGRKVDMKLSEWKFTRGNTGKMR
jgi:methylated-DNA-protein-cysteine methyltransferase related protein